MISTQQLRLSVLLRQAFVDNMDIFTSQFRVRLGVMSSFIEICSVFLETKHAEKQINTRKQPSSYAFIAYNRETAFQLCLHFLYN
jgi:hypothetical protein